MTARASVVASQARNSRHSSAAVYGTIMSASSHPDRCGRPGDSSNSKSSQKYHPTNKTRQRATRHGTSDPFKQPPNPQREISNAEETATQNSQQLPHPFFCGFHYQLSRMNPFEPSFNPFGTSQNEQLLQTILQEVRSLNTAVLKIQERLTNLEDATQKILRLHDEKVEPTLRKLDTTPLLQLGDFHDIGSIGGTSLSPASSAAPGTLTNTPNLLSSLSISPPSAPSQPQYLMQPAPMPMPVAPYQQFIPLYPAASPPAASAQQAPAAASAQQQQPAPAPAPRLFTSGGTSLYPPPGMPAPAPQPAVRIKFDERLISDASRMGYPREQVEQALKDLFSANRPCNDLNVLLDKLLEMSPAPPPPIHR
ncbi:hypothetical protein PAPYR_9997 [Paratrimastix pyriformis]|uniref:DUF1421 domain-containing protein n=1 Tax=Paratrimastix pyriformis TaxID=342808 RepID=A0ABQ8U6W4_9EUKA|nr:hypothetical protein PAPYR_9997 [Paratrimastix pyriformis]